MAVLDSVFGACVTLCNSAVSSLAPTGAWTGEVPQGDALPFVAIEHQGQKREPFSFEGGYYEIDTLVFHCFAQTAALTEQIAVAVKTAFDGTNNNWLPALNFSVRNLVKCEPKDYNLKAEFIRSPTDDTVFNAALTYEIWTSIG